MRKPPNGLALLKPLCARLGFAGTGQAHQYEDLAFLNVERDIVDAHHMACSGKYLVLGGTAREQVARWDCFQKPTANGLHGEFEKPRRRQCAGLRLQLEAERGIESTVRCGINANDWNTMLMSVRRSDVSSEGRAAAISRPPMMTR